MTAEQVLGVAQRLNVSVEALAALAAALAHRAGTTGHPAISARVDEVAAALDVGDLDALDPDDLHAAIGAIKAFFLQAADLLDHPDRPPGWMSEDPVVLQSQGRASTMVASLLAQIHDQLPGLAERLREPDAAFLDIGTGVGWLAIAMASMHPTVRVVGLDVFEPSLRLAAGNVADAGLGARIELRREDASDLAEVDAFDLAWVPGPFLPEPAVPTILTAATRAVRPGGWVVFGLYASAPEPLAVSLCDLRVVRSGGHPWTTTEAAELLHRTGLTEVAAIERTWNAPIQFVVGRVDPSFDPPPA